MIARPMGWIGTRVNRRVWLALLGLSVGLTGLAWELWRAEATAALKASVARSVAAPALAASGAATSPSGAPSGPGSPSWLSDDRPLVWRFVEAQALSRQGRDDEALSRYRSLYDDPVLGRAARYNAANVLLRQAQVAKAGPTPGNALPLVELAKEGYRQVLREQPDMAAARYNLERAQRLQPEFDEEDLSVGEPQHAERAATTMRGVAQGLP